MMNVTVFSCPQTLYKNQLDWILQEWFYEQYLSERMSAYFTS